MLRPQALLPYRSLARLQFSAAWVVEACRVDVSARGVDSASTGLADGADGVLGAVGATVGEGQRLLKADHGGLGIARVPAGKRLGLDQVQPSLVIEQLGHRPAAVRPL